MNYTKADKALSYRCELGITFHYRLIQSGFSHVFVVYSEPIEIAYCGNIYLSIFLIIQLEL